MYNQFQNVSTYINHQALSPSPRPKVVPRPRLNECLNEGLLASRKLTLISAPAGFGKTTLISDWVTKGKRPVAWLSLDEGDNDLTRFLVYFIAALQTIKPAIGAGVLGTLNPLNRHPRKRFCQS